MLSCYVKGMDPGRLVNADSGWLDTAPTVSDGSLSDKVGLIYSMFRPSDDATTLPFFVLSDLLPVTALRHAAKLLRDPCSRRNDASACGSLAAEIETALARYGMMTLEEGSRIRAYEVDGLGTA